MTETASKDRRSAGSTVVAVFAPLFPPAFRGGGPIRSTEALVAASPRDVTPIVVTSDRDLGEDQVLPVERNRWTTHEGVSVYYASLNSLRDRRRAFAAVKKKVPAVLYFNSFFDARTTIAPLLLWRFGYWGKPLLLLAPRGEFGAGALRRRTWKKRLYLAFFRALRIDRAVVWHSTALHETEDIQREWGAAARIVYRENHTMLPKSPFEPSRKPVDELRAVYMGRIVEHKGLGILLEALNSGDTKVSLDVYGVSEDSEYLAHCEDLALGVREPSSVRFNGSVAPGSVRKILAEYDVLLMPTAGENFGHVIAEALSASCPVMTTPYTQWTEVLESGAGVVVPSRDPADWVKAIQQFASKPASERWEFRRSAGAVYAAWAARAGDAHVWELALEGAWNRGTFRESTR